MVRVVVVVVAERPVQAHLVVAAQLLRSVLPPQQPEVAAARPVPLPQQPEVAAVVAVVLVQGLVASEILRSR